MRIICKPLFVTMIVNKKKKKKKKKQIKLKYRKTISSLYPMKKTSDFSSFVVVVVFVVLYCIL